MIFDFTKNFVPEAYSESRDYRVLLRMLGIMMTDHKYNIDHLIDLYSASSCPDNLLELLAGMVGYDYDESLNLYHTRMILEYFPYLLRNRGSEIGMKLAMALSLNVSDDVEKPAIEEINLQIDHEHGVIRIYYPEEYTIKKDLIEYVRPVGMMVRELKTAKIKAVNEIHVKATADYHSHIYSKLDATVGRSQLGFDENYKEEEENEEE